MSIVAPSGMALRVLVVDPNDNEIAGILTPFMKSPGSEFSRASDRSSALQIAAAFLPNVALVDLGLPRLEGFHLARQMRQIELPRQVWLVAGSPFGDTAYRTLAKEAGFDDFVMKPFTACRLQSVIEKFLNTVVPEQNGVRAEQQPIGRAD